MDSAPRARGGGPPLLLPSPQRITTVSKKTRSERIGVVYGAPALARQPGQPTWKAVASPPLKRLHQQEGTALPALRLSQPRGTQMQEPVPVAAVARRPQAAPEGSRRIAARRALPMRTSPWLRSIQQQLEGKKPGMVAVGGHADRVEAEGGGRGTKDALLAFGLSTLGPIAQGAFSQVVRAREVGSGATVAVKSCSTRRGVPEHVRSEVECLRQLQERWVPPRRAPGLRAARHPHCPHLDVSGRALSCCAQLACTRGELAGCAREQA